VAWPLDLLPWMALVVRHVHELAMGRGRGGGGGGGGEKGERLAAGGGGVYGGGGGGGGGEGTTKVRRKGPEDKGNSAGVR